MPELKDVQIVGPLGPLHHGPATAKGMCVLLLKPLLQDDPGYLELYKSVAIICLEPDGSGLASGCVRPLVCNKAYSEQR